MAKKMSGSGEDRIKAKGYGAMNKKEKLKPFNFERRALRDDDILIKVAYCGICHSDIHTVRDEWDPASYPVVPGHEVVGKVVRIGPAVKKFKVGDVAGVGCMVSSCHMCEACKAGEEYDCANTVWTYDSEEPHIGGRTYGGYSDGIVVEEGFALKVSPKADLAATAPLMCAGITTYSPLKYWKAGPGKKVGVVGLGGLGHVAVKIANSMGARVVVLTTSSAKAQDALRLGAKEAVITTDRDAFQAHSNSFDLIIDTVAAQHDINDYLSLLKRNGAVVLVGLPSNQLSFKPFSVVKGRHVIAGSVIGGIRETQEMLDYCAKNNITADVEVIAIQKVNEAYERVVKGDVKYRFVIDMSTL